METTSELEIILSESESVRVRVGAELSIVKVILSVPEQALPDRSVPETVAVVDVSDVDTVHVYSQIEAEDVADIIASEVIPKRLIVGVEAILSENVAVMVITDESDTVRIDGFDVRITDGLTKSVAFV